MLIWAFWLGIKRAEITKIVILIAFCNSFSISCIHYFHFPVSFNLSSISWIKINMFSTIYTFQGTVWFELCIISSTFLFTFPWWRGGHTEITQILLFLVSCFVCRIKSTKVLLLLRGWLGCISRYTMFFCTWCFPFWLQFTSIMFAEISYFIWLGVWL